jgi:malonyl CoA-acyl carrier protein transacylase
MSRHVTAVVFPGQGSQEPDMRVDVERHRPDLLELAEAEVPGLFDRVEEGTRFAQPAIYCASLAGYHRIGEEADLYAGHSLGEIAALTAAGAVSEEDGLHLVALRGRVMQEAGAERAGDGMLALIGRPGKGDPAAISERHGLAVANDNAPGQVVLSGPGAALDAATAEAEDAGLRSMRLPVTGAFHSPAMASAVPEYEAGLRDVAFTAPRVPVLSGVTAQPFDDVRARLAESLTHPVRWREVLLALGDRGVERIVETGPGRVLTGLARRTLDGVETVSADQLEAARA